MCQTKHDTIEISFIYTHVFGSSSHMWFVCVNIKHTVSPLNIISFHVYCLRRFYLYFIYLRISFPLAEIVVQYRCAPIEGKRKSKQTQISLNKCSSSSGCCCCFFFLFYHLFRLWFRQCLPMILLYTGKPIQMKKKKKKNARVKTITARWYVWYCVFFLLLIKSWLKWSHALMYFIYL